ncbi:MULTISPECIES: hypothetical protein [Bradyrhizobium]|jgi:hypothetical protein|uniref:Uncharacterized protein n=2 Tax=Bradyrhizobium elkanii TaxID=29448 RepID=A0ABV4EPZ5_BRAEL|nr:MULTISPECIES: hypothetical protein [Bradyrhizobium]MCA1398962.1 hypothetical protein [Bradyrhizobium sp. BRP56]MCP1975840.1 hypothetical protein [Bradyrhizobium elkanii]MCP1985019.1 hypothetical protein [Bradyrhizobium elkanii]MCS4112892.1 hypothetical protein [Bradyrhizobium elkanii]MCS4220526.1 hypothetical protein [Bradyrhizobium elkanii]
MMIISPASQRPPSSPSLASTQLNIVTLIDVAGTLRTGGLSGKTGLMDNGGESTGKGTNSLRTVCRQGQALNWLVYCTDMEKRPDGSWPLFARIVNIVFVLPDGTPELRKICNDLKIYGGPDKIRSPWTPSYYYWAGAVDLELEPGLYPYRLVVEVDTVDRNRKSYFNLDGPALQVIPLSAIHAGSQHG